MMNPVLQIFLIVCTVLIVAPLAEKFAWYMIKTGRGRIVIILYLCTLAALIYAAVFHSEDIINEWRQCESTAPVPSVIQIDKQAHFQKPADFKVINAIGIWKQIRRTSVINAKKFFARFGIKGINSKHYISFKSLPLQRLVRNTTTDFREYSSYCGEKGTC